jgi:hypothetical protein
MVFVMLKVMMMAMAVREVEPLEDTIAHSAHKHQHQAHDLWRPPAAKVSAVHAPPPTQNTQNTRTRRTRTFSQVGSKFWKTASEKATCGTLW